MRRLFYRRRPFYRFGRGAYRRGWYAGIALALLVVVLFPELYVTLSNFVSRVGNSLGSNNNRGGGVV